MASRQRHLMPTYATVDPAGFDCCVKVVPAKFLMWRFHFCLEIKLDLGSNFETVYFHQNFSFEWGKNQFKTTFIRAVKRSNKTVFLILTYLLHLIGQKETDGGRGVREGEKKTPAPLHCFTAGDLPITPPAGGNEGWSWAQILLYHKVYGPQGVLPLSPENYFNSQE